MVDLSGNDPEALTDPNLIPGRQILLKVGGMVTTIWRLSELPDRGQVVWNGRVMSSDDFWAEKDADFRC